MHSEKKQVRSSVGLGLTLVPKRMFDSRYRAPPIVKYLLRNIKILRLACIFKLSLLTMKSSIMSLLVVCILGCLVKGLGARRMISTKRSAVIDEVNLCNLEATENLTYFQS